MKKDILFLFSLSLLLFPREEANAAFADKFQIPSIPKLFGAGGATVLRAACEEQAEEVPPSRPLQELQAQVERSGKEWDKALQEFSQKMGCKAAGAYGVVVYDRSTEQASPQDLKELKGYQKEMVALRAQYFGRMRQFWAYMTNLKPNVAPHASCHETSAAQVQYGIDAIREISALERELRVVEGHVYYQRMAAGNAPELPEGEGPDYSMFHRLEKKYQRNTLPKKCGAQYTDAYRKLLQRTRELREAMNKMHAQYLRPLEAEMRNLREGAACVQSRCESLPSP